MTAAQIDPQEVLKAFYRSYADWLRAGAEERMPFTRQYGLCTNLDNYVYREHGSNPVLEAAVGDLMKQQFMGAGLDAVYPFGGYGAYQNERRAMTQHLNPERMAWVMQHEI
jgi:hypothetical protein